MRTIGRKPPAITAQPTAEGLRSAARQQAIGQAFAASATTGIAKGVYRFRGHEEAERQRLEALVRVVAASARRLRRA